MSEQKNRPHQLKLGRIRAKVWTNTKDDGSARYSVDIFRTYRVDEKKREGGDDGWRDVYNFSEEDLKMLPILIDELKQYIETDKAS